MKLSKRLELNRAERPDEWEMDEFIRGARSLEITEVACVCGCISMLAKICAGTEEDIVTRLTGYLWDEEERAIIQQQLQPDSDQ
jgi:hypothetical protein